MHEVAVMSQHAGSRKIKGLNGLVWSADDSLRSRVRRPQVVHLERHERKAWGVLGPPPQAQAVKTRGPCVDECGFSPGSSLLVCPDLDVDGEMMKSSCRSNSAEKCDANATPRCSPSTVLLFLSQEFARNSITTMPFSVTTAVGLFSEQCHDSGFPEGVRLIIEGWRRESCGLPRWSSSTTFVFHDAASVICYQLG